MTTKRPQKVPALPTTVLEVLQAAEVLLAGGWTRKPGGSHRRGGVTRYSITGAVRAVTCAGGPDPLDGIKGIYLRSHALDFLAVLAGDYIGVDSAEGVEPARILNDQFPLNDGRRRALLFMAEAVDAGKELLEEFHDHPTVSAGHSHPHGGAHEHLPLPDPDDQRRSMALSLARVTAYWAQAKGPADG